MTRRRTQPETGPAGAAETVPVDLAVAAHVRQCDAAEARNWASWNRDRAQELRAAAGARAARIVDEAETKAREHTTAADAAEHEARELEELAQHLNHAATLETQAAEPGHQADASTGRLPN